MTSDDDDDKGDAADDLAADDDNDADNDEDDDNDDDDEDEDDDDAEKQDADHVDHENGMKQDHEKVTTLNLARQRLTCNFQSLIILASTNRRSFTILPESIAHVFDTTVHVSLSGITLQLVDVIFEKIS
jgi:hypothetical protein